MMNQHQKSIAHRKLVAHMNIPPEHRVIFVRKRRIIYHDDPEQLEIILDEVTLPDGESFIAGYNDKVNLLAILEN